MQRRLEGRLTVGVFGVGRVRMQCRVARRNKDYLQQQAARIARAHEWSSSVARAWQGLLEMSGGRFKLMPWVEPTKAYREVGQKKKDVRLLAVANFKADERPRAT